MRDYEEARSQLLKTVAWLEGINPSAAGSLREGLEETLTVHRLGLPEQLRRNFQSTNLIESAIGVTRALTDRVKRWRGGDMRLRWAASGIERSRRMSYSDWPGRPRVAGRMIEGLDIAVGERLE